MWIIVNEKEQEKAREQQAKLFDKIREEEAQKRRAREAHEAAKCPHCGRNDPLPPWLI